MEWQKCPRCKSNRVGKRGEEPGCFGIIVMILLSAVVWSFVASAFPATRENIVSIIIALIAFVLFYNLRIILFGYLYCKDCELSFKPKKKK